MLLEKLEEIVCPVQLLDVFSRWHLYIIRLNLEQLTVERRENFEGILKENIDVNVHSRPVYYYPYYQKLGYFKGLCPNADQLYEEIITLPLFPVMSRQDINDVIHAVKKVISYYRKRM